MFKNYFKIAFRNLYKQKGFAFLNITGLAIGVFAFLMIILFVRHELSYDLYHNDSENIYRVAVRGALSGNEFNMPYSPAPVGAAFVEEIPGVIKSTRVRNFGFPVIRYGDKVFSEELWFSADSSFFDVFTVEFIQGDQKTALAQPNSVVITKSAAERYFGDENPMGKIMTDNFPGTPNDYTITGFIEDPPENTHFHYDFLASMNTYPQAANDPIWVSNNFFTYLVLDKNTSYKQVEDVFPAMVDKYAGPQIEQFLGISFEKLKENGASYGFYLQGLTDIHLRSTLEGELEPTGTLVYVQIFFLIAIFILVIACINFMNLATARSAKRSKEVGIRKTLGADRKQLIQQFLSESILLSFVSVLIALLLVQLLLPSFNNITGLTLGLNLFSDPWLIPILLLLTFGVGTISGIYPAFYLASINPVQVLKGGSMTKGRQSWLRSGLVIFQFIVSVTLFTGTLVVRNQLNYIQTKELGYDNDNVVMVKKTDDIRAHIEAFKTDLRQNSNIINVSNSSSLMGHQTGNNSVHQIAGEPAENAALLNIVVADHYYAETYELEMVEGHFFRLGMPADSLCAVINEAAITALQISDPIGKTLLTPGGGPGGGSRTIIGVVKDFHFQSLHLPIRPMVIYLWGAGGGGVYTAVRIVENNAQASLNFIESTWKKYAVDQPHEYVFLKDDFKQTYAAESRTKSIVTIFSLLAIFIACLGLFGLASYSIEQRTKEIGIRKVLGASVPNIYLLLSQDILKLVLIAAIISWPISYYSMNDWLENFAFRIGFNHFSFLFAGLIALIIALGTVTTQTIKAATVNPVRSLKYE